MHANSTLYARIFNFIESRMHMYAHLGLTCLQHFWQNVQDLLHAAAVTLQEQAPNKREHRKLTLEKNLKHSWLPAFWLLKKDPKHTRD